MARPALHPLSYLPFAGNFTLYPADLHRGGIYRTPMGAEGPVLIVSVGPKWITFREERGIALHGPRWGKPMKLLRSGWEGAAYFEEIEPPPSV